MEYVHLAFTRNRCDSFQISPCHLYKIVSNTKIQQQFGYYFLPEASIGLRVLSLPVSVWVCVGVCVRQSRVCPHGNSTTD